MPALHPTILIGYGRYGLRVLEALLAGAASRGALAWDDSQEVAVLNERRLRALSLFWIPDVLGLEMQKASDARHGLEMMDDLYSQIERIPATDTGVALAERVEAAKQRLFDELRLRQKDQQVTLGLDVIVIAQPTHDSVIGKLRELMAPVMSRLAADPGLAAKERQTLLHFVQILDFDDFWNPSAQQAAVRQALLQAIEAGEQSHHPSYGRIYLFDGRTRLGNHSPQMRMDEAVLFLDFLIFEGNRSDAHVRPFYQREENFVAPLCVAGVRAIEYSVPRMQRLAAANFGSAWLRYLVHPDPVAGTLDPVLSRFNPEGLAALAGDADMNALLEQAIQAIERDLIAIPMTDSKWPSRIREEARKRAAHWRTRIAEAAGQRSRLIARDELGPLRRKIVDEVQKAASDPSSPRTAGGLLAEIDRWRDRLRSVSQPASFAPAAPPNLDWLFAEFQDFRSKRVEPARMRNRWWLLMAIAATVAILPMAQDLILDTYGEDWAPAWVRLLILALPLIALLWFAGSKIFHPKVQRLVERPVEFYTDPDKGRMVAAIREYVRSTEVEGMLRREAAEALHNLRSRIAVEVAGILEHVRASLAERCREMLWLQRQLDEYLNLHGVKGGDSPEFMSRHQQDRVLISLAHNRDLQRIASRRKRHEGDYREAQRRFAVMSGWEQKYDDVFLEPHRFLDRLSEWFPLPDWTDAGHEMQRFAEGLMEGIEHVHPFDASFFWFQEQGLPSALGHAAAPEPWLRLADVEGRISGHGYTSRLRRRLEGDRLYMIQARLGIPADLLRTAG